MNDKLKEATEFITPSAPTVGRIVHVKSGDFIAPAIVTAVHSPTCINVRVFQDNDFSPERRTSLVFDMKLPTESHWCWPPR